MNGKKLLLPLPALLVGLKQASGVNHEVSLFGNRYTRLYARKKSSGKWDILFNDEDEDFQHIGNSYKELYINEDYIEGKGREYRYLDYRQTL